MALRRFTRPVDGTIPVPALLYPDEELSANQGGVGIYDGPQKSPDHPSGTVHISTHRLFYIDAQDDLARSFALDLARITRTDYYTGLFKSSPKVTLYLSPEPSTNSRAPGDGWECAVCGYRNPPSLGPSACDLCGVARDAVPSEPLSASPKPPPIHLSTSLPSPTLPSPSGVACPACTFLNHPSLPSCEMCGTELPQRQRQRLGMKSAPTSRPVSPDLSSEDDQDRMAIIKLSFRKGGDKAFYAVLKRSLHAKAWEAPPRALSGDAVTKNGSRSGIHGILQDVESSAQSQTSSMAEALRDLEALMAKARGMVRLAAELGERVTRTGASESEPEEAAFIRASLAQLGLPAPSTSAPDGDERAWLVQLARELADVLQREGNRGVMKGRGIIALDEAWGGWNRARGTALIPPSTFLQVLPHLTAYTAPPLHARTFPSGLSVLHAPEYTPSAFAARLSEGCTTTEAAGDERVHVALAAEILGAAEAEGLVCRDGDAVEVRWWPNIFAGYRWDGQ